MAPATVFELRARLPAGLRTVYLLFSIGFAPRTGRRLTLDDVCLEALRLAELLTDRAATRTPEGQALAALLCLQAARLPARADTAGKLVLLRDQDRAAWDWHLVDRGRRHLDAA